ncbi:MULTISPECIES: hypothetical protein [unclassified Streptomyces]|uniref:hypothetical protein n=1 Tax=unclassified Streptomyces TaxID=2593676 RepID=UPI002DDC000B|nr:hypothetical protein [Streptomyces sp. NBC_01445]WSE11353.1 hypothetical protein OG574_49895 [Streptomyces sp. NBC_01445]
MNFRPQSAHTGRCASRSAASRSARRCCSSRAAWRLRARPRPEDFPAGPLSVHVPLRDLHEHAEGERILRAHFAALLDGPFTRMAAELSLLQIAALAVGLIPRDLLRAIAAELAAVDAQP